MSDEQNVNPNVWRQLEDLLTESFPVENVDEEVQEFLNNVKVIFEQSNIAFDEIETLEELIQQISDLVVPEVNRKKDVGEETTSYPAYILSAYHDRNGPDFESGFVGAPAVVRVPLAKSNTGTIFTQYGLVLSFDHFVFSIDDINEKYSEQLGYQAEAVDLITGPRLWGFRFSPLSVYFVYKNKDDAEPSNYILESGDGLGFKGVLYTQSPPMGGIIIEKGGYKPTPFSDPNNMYHGYCTNNGRDPVEAQVKSYHDGELYITVTGEYQLITDPKDAPAPIHLTMQALERVMALEDGFDMLGSLQLISIMLARRGRRLNWVKLPPCHKACLKDE